MLGLSVSKLLLLILLILGVWYGYKYMGRVEAVRRALREELQRRHKAQAPPRSIEAEDLSKCPVCGAYVAAKSAGNCGRADCPWGR